MNMNYDETFCDAIYFNIYIIEFFTSTIKDY